MADVQANISLVTTGGDASAQEIDKATQALNRTSASSEQLQSRFQEKFQHIGLNIFAGDALRASGLGRETRAVVTTLNLALTEAGEAAGLASGGLLLVLGALTALVGVVAVVAEHHKNLADSLNKVVEAQQKSLETTNTNITTLDAYRNAVGNLTPAQQALYGAEYNLMVLQKGELLDSINKQIVAVQAQMQAQLEHAKVMDVVHSAYQTVKTALTEHLEMLGKIYPALGLLVDAYKLLEKGIGAVKTALSSHVASMTLSKKATDELATAQTPLQVKLKELQLELTTGGQKWQDYFKKATDASKAATDKMKKDSDSYWDAVSKSERLEAKMNQETQKAISKDQAEQLKVRAKQDEEAAKEVLKGITLVGDAFGKSFAQMALEGKNLGDQLSEAATQMAEQFIEKVIAMAIEWAILRAVMSIYPAGAAAYTAAANAAYPALSNMMASSAGKPYHAAVGGEMLADKPTMVMFGENGPEVASFTPMSGASTSAKTNQRGQGGGDTYYNEITIQVVGITDPQSLATKVGQILAQNIRGGGQISLART